MRWIVLALLFTNIGLYAWYKTAAGPVSPSAETIPQAPVEQGARILLVREASKDQLRPVEGGAEPKPVTGEAKLGTAEALCTLLGPFEEEYQGLDIVERLSALRVDASLREIEMPGQMRYWVYLAPLSSKREAFNKLRELQAAGIDSYVIPKGSLTNGISFGIFSEPGRAKSLVAKLRQRGIAAESREEPETYLERWIVLPPGTEEALAESFWVQLQSEYPKLDRRQNLCREVSGR